MKRRKLSKKLVDTIRVSQHKHYEIARAARLHQSAFSQIINGIVLTRVGDSRVLDIAQIVDVPAAECWEQEETE